MTNALTDGACPSLTARSTLATTSSGIETASFRLILSSYSAGACITADETGSRRYAGLRSAHVMTTANARHQTTTLL